MNQPTDPKITGIYAGLLSMTEVGLGSILHSFKIPLAGTFLSLNQSLFLTRVTKLNRGAKDSRTLGLQVSNVTALLKSLSPAGQKLMPMLAISVQGLLFSLGTLLLGANVMGCLTGAVLSSVWGIFQPLAFLWLVYGSTLNEEQLSKVLETFSKWFGGRFELEPHMLWQVILSLVLIKALLATIIGWVAWYAPLREEELFNSGLMRLKLKPIQINRNQTKPTNSFLGAFHDLSTPFFLVPFLMTGIFFWFSNHQNSQWIWLWLRPLAIAYLIFLMIRLFPISNWVKRMGWGGTALESALSFIEGQTTSQKDNNGKHDSM